MRASGESSGEAKGTRGEQTENGSKRNVEKERKRQGRTERQTKREGGKVLKRVAGLSGGETSEKSARREGSNRVGGSKRETLNEGVDGNVGSEVRYGFERKRSGETAKMRETEGGQGQTLTF